MRFYRFSGLITNEKWGEKMDDRLHRCWIRHDMVQKSLRFHDFFSNRRVQFFVVSASDELIGGIVDDEGLDDRLLRKSTGDYVKALGLLTSGLKLEEVTLQTMKNLLSSSNRNDFIDDDDEVLERFGLQGFYNYKSGVEFGEDLIENSSKESIYWEAKRYLAADTFLPELDRIYAGGKRNTGLGHPVHYFIRTDDRDTRREIYRLLLSALSFFFELLARTLSLINRPSRTPSSSRTPVATISAKFLGVLPTIFT